MARMSTPKRMTRGDSQKASARKSGTSVKKPGDVKMDGASDGSDDEAIYKTVPYPVAQGMAAEKARKQRARNQAAGKATDAVQ